MDAVVEWCLQRIWGERGRGSGREDGDIGHVSEMGVGVTAPAPYDSGEEGGGQMEKGRFADVDLDRDTGLRSRLETGVTSRLVRRAGAGPGGAGSVRWTNQKSSCLEVFAGTATWTLCRRRTNRLSHPIPSHPSPPSPPSQS